MLDNQTTQPSKFKTKNWVEINNQSNRTHGPNSQIKFNTNLVRLLKGSFWGGARGGGLRNLKLEILYISTYTYVVSENIPFSTKALLILLISATFCKKSAFFAKIVLKKSFTDYASRVWLLNYSKLAINRKKDDDVTIYRHDVTVNIFWGFFDSLFKFVTGQSFMSISSLVLELWKFSFTRDWSEIRKSEIPWNTRVFPNIWRLGRVRDAKFGMNV